MKKIILPFLLFLFLFAACAEESNKLTISGYVDDTKTGSVEIECDKKCAKALGVVDLQPVPRGTLCTRIYGGPEEITLTGRADGQEIDASFNKSGGCEIARFESLAPFFSEMGIISEDIFPE